MGFKIKIEPAAKRDVQKEINYYNSKQNGLGKKFYAEVNVFFKTIKTNPFYQVRYDDVRCLPLNIFPAMIHFTLDETKKIIIIRAVINTNKDPNVFWLKK
jgi:toxin ParE1/3/4